MKSLLMVATLVLLSGCGVTEWQRDQDERAAAFRDLQSPEMLRRIEEARALK